MERRKKKSVFGEYSCNAIIFITITINKGGAENTTMMIS